MCLPAAGRGLLDEACRPVKVLVTGASSLIGGGVATSLVRRGESVVTFQRRAVPGLTDLPVPVTHQLHHVDFFAALAPLFSKVDIT